MAAVWWTILGMRRQVVGELSRYVTVGVLNTAWGYLLIFAFMYLAHWSPEASNIAGYAIGLLTSYLLNRKFTFNSQAKMSGEFGRFIVIFAIAFLANFATLAFLVRVLEIHAGMGQLVAGVVYVVTSYLLNRTYTFRRY